MEGISDGKVLWYRTNPCTLTMKFTMTQGVGKLQLVGDKLCLAEISVSQKRMALPKKGLFRYNTNYILNNDIFLTEIIMKNAITTFSEQIQKS